MSGNRQAGPNWLKASRSVGSGACVELVRMGNRVAIRDSKNPELFFLFERSVVESFFKRVRHSQYDYLIDGKGPGR
jgi:Domain of unknown function (DUF397)